MERAINATSLLFSKDTMQIIANMSSEELDNTLTGVPAVEINKETLNASMPDVTTFLADATIFPSKGEARKMIQGGGVSINKEKISNPNEKLMLGLLQDKYLLVQKGKKNYYIVEIR